MYVACRVVRNGKESDYLCNVNQQIHTFQINVLINFLVSSSCFKHYVFIVKKTIVHAMLYGMFFILRLL